MLHAYDNGPGEIPGILSFPAHESDESSGDEDRATSVGR